MGTIINLVNITTIWNIGDTVNTDCPECGLQADLEVGGSRWVFDDSGESFSVDLPISESMISDELIRLAQKIHAFQRTRQNTPDVRDEEFPI